MGKNKYVQHKYITTKNINGDDVEIFYFKHYGEEGYIVKKVNNREPKRHGAWESLENAIKSTEN